MKKYGVFKGIQCEKLTDTIEEAKKYIKANIAKTTKDIPFLLIEIDNNYEIHPIAEYWSAI